MCDGSLLVRQTNKATACLGRWTRGGGVRYLIIVEMIFYTSKNRTGAQLPLSWAWIDEEVSTAGRHLGAVVEGCDARCCVGSRYEKNPRSSTTEGRPLHV